MSLSDNFNEGFELRLNVSWRRVFITSCLAQLTDYKKLVDFLREYVAFNSPFAGAIARLTGKIHSCHYLFRDKNEPEFDLADRSAEIASRIFFTAEDEYDVCHLGKRVTHRGLAQFFLRELLRTGPTGDVRRHKENGLAEITNNLTSKVRNAYDGATLRADESLFYAMGFHLASERFADQEFNLIDDFLRRNFPQLVERLLGKKGPAGLDAYYWISVHCIVETEHAESAISAIRLALNYYIGNCEQDQLVNAALEGVDDFARIQETLFKHAARLVPTKLITPQPAFGTGPLCHECEPDSAG